MEWRFEDQPGMIQCSEVGKMRRNQQRKLRRRGTSEKGDPRGSEWVVTQRPSKERLLCLK